MGVTVARYRQGDAERWGVVNGDALTPVPGEFATLTEFLERGRQDAFDLRDGASEGSIPIDSVEILGPVTRPCSVVCQGLNYGGHRAEAGTDVDKPPFNLMFMKADSSLSGPYDDVIRPKGVKLLDYELELGLVIGAPIRGFTKITDANLADYVAGICISNDVSARDVQIPQQQWFKGKSFRTFCPTGPYLYLIESSDVPELSNIDIELKVDGESRQKSNTDKLLYGPAETLTELSGLMDLDPGDLIQTGTPEGVAIKAPSATQQRIARILMNEKKIFQVFMKRQMENPNYLKDGQVMELTMRTPDGSIDLGVMKTKVVPSA